MSDLRPQKRAINIGGEQYSLLFTIATIDEIQSGHNIALFDGIHVLQELTPENYTVDNLRILAAFLSAILTTNGYDVDLAQAVDILQHEEPQAVALMLVLLFAESAPEKDDEEEDDEESDEDPEPSVNVARILTVAHEQMKYPEEEIWRMTMRKYNILLNQHLILAGRKKEEDIDTAQMFAG